MTPQSAWARPTFQVIGKGRGRLARAMYRDGFNVAEIAYTLHKARGDVRRLLHRGQQVERVR